MLKCARCQKPLTVAYVQDGPFAWGPKCAKIQGFTTPTGPRIKTPEPQSKDDAQMTLDMEPVKITQGHKYIHLQMAKPVIVLEVLPFFARVGVMSLPDAPWFHRIEEVSFDDLRPLPMKYFHGQIPA